MYQELHVYISMPQQLCILQTEETYRGLVTCPSGRQCWDSHSGLLYAEHRVSLREGVLQPHFHCRLRGLQSLQNTSTNVRLFEMYNTGKQTV